MIYIFNFSASGTNCERLITFTFLKIRLMWVFTVCSLMQSFGRSLCFSTLSNKCDDILFFFTEVGTAGVHQMGRWMVEQCLDLVIVDPNLTGLEQPAVLWQTFPGCIGGYDTIKLMVQKQRNDFVLR